MNAEVTPESEEWRPATGPDADAWKLCTTWKEAGELAARWFEGKSTFMPGNYDPQPDEETTPLLETLAAINRLGYFTDQSQPGVAIADGCGQRAFVSGYCSETVAAVIASELLSTELVVITIPPSSAPAGQICVTIDGGEQSTWVGIAGSSHDIADQYFHETNERFAALLADSWQVHVFDPQWGRNELLWERLVPAMKLAAKTEFIL